MSPAAIWMTPCPVWREKFPASSFCVILPSVGFGNRPVSGRSVTLTRSPIANSFKEFARDSKIAMGSLLNESRATRARAVLYGPYESLCVLRLFAVTFLRFLWLRLWRGRHNVHSQSSHRLSLNALLITETELNVIATLASTG